MLSFSWRVTYFMVLCGLFVLVALVAATYQNANAVFYGLLPLVGLFVFLFGVFVGNLFSKPLRKIIQAAKELADGNIKSRVYVKDRGELGQLAKAVNAIGERMERAEYEKEKIRHSVAMKVSSMVQPFHDTIGALEEKAKNRTADFHRANELAEKMQIDLLLKEAELVDVKGQMAKLMQRKAKRVMTTQEI